MSHTSDQLIRRLWQKNGVIVRTRGASLLAIHPRGDRRCRRIGWIEAVDANEWLDRGLLTKTPRGLALSDAVIHRLRHGETPRVIQETMRGSSATLRAAQAKTVPVVTMDRLLDKDGNRVFSDAQVEAARRFARDLRRAGQSGGKMANFSASDLSAPHVDGTRRHDRAEDAAIRRVDAGRAVASAKKGLDQRVVRVLTRVIGADETLEAVDRRQGWGPGVGAMLMQIGLDHLARHYNVRERCFR